MTTQLPRDYYTHRASHVRFGHPDGREYMNIAYDRATMWRGSYVHPDSLADVAANASLASGMAARDALVNYVARYYGYEADPDNPVLVRYTLDALNWPREAFDGLDEHVETYIRPRIGMAPHHSASCACDACSPCGCQLHTCVRCFPPTADRPHGHYYDCRCAMCRPPVFDDENDNDDWAGTPDLPDPPPNRCRFGIELEWNDGGGNTRAPILRALVRQGIAAEDIRYTHEITRFWKMTTDSTVSGGELVSPILSGDDRSIDQVRDVIRLIKDNGGQTGRNVGMHVHLDVTPFERAQLKVLAHNLRKAERFFASFVPEHRYASGGTAHGARLMTDVQWTEIESWLDHIDVGDRARNGANRSGSCPVGRSVSFNFNSLLTYGTIECRLLGHTLNTVKVKTWVRTLQAIIEASRRKRKLPDGDVLAWLSGFGLDTELAEHFRSVAIRRGNERFLIAA